MVAESLIVAPVLYVRVVFTLTQSLLLDTTNPPIEMLVMYGFDDAVFHSRVPLELVPRYRLAVVVPLTVMAETSSVPATSTSPANSLVCDWLDA